MKKFTLSIGMMAFIFLAVLGIALVKKASPSESVITGDDIEIAILGTEKQQDHSICVTAEITNDSHYTIERNRLFITALSDGEGAAHTHESGSTWGEGVATADDPIKHIIVQELEGSFEHIGSNESVKIRFVVPSEYALSRPLYVVFQGWEIRGQNTAGTGAITVTEPLLLPD